MSPELDDTTIEEPVEPVGHVRVVYLGPVAPHWDVQSDFGEPELIETFRDRVLARLVLLPPHDPQFRRNRERVVRDAERENLTLDWDLGFPEEACRGELVGQADPLEPETRRVHLGRGRQVASRGPQTGQAVLARPVDHPADEGRPAVDLLAAEVESEQRPGRLLPRGLGRSGSGTRPR